MENFKRLKEALNKDTLDMALFKQIFTDMVNGGEPISALFKDFAIAVFAGNEELALYEFHEIRAAVGWVSFSASQRSRHILGLDK